MATDVTINFITDGGEDIAIGSDGAADANFSASTTFPLGRLSINYRSLARIDLSSIIPAGSVINSAVYKPFCIVAAPVAEGVSFEELQDGWVHSQVTWNNKATGTPWTTPGGDLYEINDPITVLLPTVTGRISYPGFENFVQTALDARAGMLIFLGRREVEAGANAAAIFTATASGDEDGAAQLDINYTPPPNVIYYERGVGRGCRRGLVRGMS